MNKREFLRALTLMVLGGGATTVLGGQRHPRGTAPRVLVIGAGLAGLAAAQSLRRAGCPVVVLEARERIGGRLWTSTRWPEMPVDLGASWIHGVTGNPLTALADASGAQRRVTSFARTATFHADGRLFSEQEERQLEQIRALIRKALKAAQALDADRSVRQAVAPLARDLAAQPEALRWLAFCLSGMLEHEYAGSADLLSAHWFDSGKAFDGEDALLARGYGVIAAFLARDLDVRTSEVVKEIRWQEPGVSVQTARNRYDADAVVVTLPLGVLQHNDVQFVPQLPPAKRQAIRGLGMGVLNKCCLRFPRAFWPDDLDWIEYVSAQPGAWNEWVSFQHTMQWPVLLGFNAADHGRAMEAWSDAAIVSSALDTLKTMFGSSVPQPVDVQITRWASDPFARGSYSFNAVGGSPELRAALAAPLADRLFFAGEACSSDHFGTAHGAYLSGLQAAEAVIAQSSRSSLQRS